MPVIVNHDSHLFDVAGQRDLIIERAKGFECWDVAGNRYLDFMSGHGVMNLGHGRREIVQAVAQQAQSLTHMGSAFEHPERTRLAQRLIGLTGMQGGRVFLSNSGTESVEAALKFARHHTGRSEMIGFIRGFHGRTYGALSAGFNPRHRKGIGSLLPDCRHLPFGDVAALRRTISDQTAAVILELVQGEGGVRIAEPGFINAVQDLCRRHGTLLIIDEVQTGFGRCGQPFAFQVFGVQPDILCLAKALGGGFPLGATVFRSDIQPVRGLHGSTFGGNLVSCAAAHGFLDLFEREFEDLEVAEKGAHLAESLRAMSRVTEVRQMGLMIGADVPCQASLLLQYLQNDGLLAISAGPQTLRFLPPLTISWDGLNEGIRILRRTLD